MSFRAHFPHCGVEVTVDTIDELRQVVAALGAEMTLDKANHLATLLHEARSTAPPPRPKRPYRPQPGRERKVQQNQPDLERGILALLQERPRSGHDLAAAASVAQVTITRYLRTLEAAGRIHRQGTGRFTKWGLGKGPKEGP